MSARKPRKGAKKQQPTPAIKVDTDAKQQSTPAAKVDTDAVNWEENISSTAIDKVFKGCCQLKKNLENGHCAKSLLEVAETLKKLVDESEGRTNCVIKSGVWKFLLKWLESDDTALVEASMRTLAQMPRRVPQKSDDLLDRGILPAVCSLFDTTRSSLSNEVVKPVSWCIGNLFANCTSAPPQDDLLKCLPPIARLLTFSESHVLNPTCTALLFIIERVQKIDTERPEIRSICESLKKIIEDPDLQKYEFAANARNIMNLINNMVHRETDETQQSL